ncbi:transposase [Streptomyces olivaceoviridis]|uniref:transposase n=1 Tax=Streptomyces olivaceoviridis TaxID=1921 RepID=UPI0036F8617F
MLDGRRKSIQPMAERLPDGNMKAAVRGPEEWAADHHRRRRAGIPDEVGHASKPRLALGLLGLLDRLAGQELAVPVIVADAGHGRSVSFRLALEERGWSYVVAVDPKEIPRRGLGPPTLHRYREAPRPLPGLVEEAAVSRRSCGGRAARAQHLHHLWLPGVLAFHAGQ